MLLEKILRISANLGGLIKPSGKKVQKGRVHRSHLSCGRDAKELSGGSLISQSTPESTALIRSDFCEGAKSPYGGSYANAPSSALFNCLMVQLRVLHFQDRICFLGVLSGSQNLCQSWL